MIRYLFLLALTGHGLFVQTAFSKDAAEHYREGVEPLLAELCFDCHGDGADKGDVALDAFDSEDAILGSHEHWWKVLKMVRAELMPPSDKPQPTIEQRALLESWIKSAVFRVEPDNPDPGRIALQRLNREEYRNTIRDLIGVDFNTNAEFPSDDSGHGFDNTADVLTVSPMLMEKYLDAAKTIIAEAVPIVSGIPSEQEIPGKKFVKETENADSDTEESPDAQRVRRGRRDDDSLTLSCYEAATATARLHVEQPGDYTLVLNLRANERYVDNQFDYNKAQFKYRIDGEEVVSREFVREGGKPFAFAFDRTWDAGEHLLEVEVTPLTPDEKQVRSRSLSLRIGSVTLRGPLDEEHWIHPENYERFFPEPIPKSSEDRRQYAQTLLSQFAFKAFRRPVEESIVERLVGLAESIYVQVDKTFEEGVANAMMAVLASPQFLFREESVEAAAQKDVHPFVDEYSLASRLSYFFWSSMPDDELFRLAGQGELRKQLELQVDRMLEDSRSEALIKNFTGQWLQARDVESVNISEFAVRRREQKRDPKMERLRDRFRELRRIDEEKLTAAEKKELEEVRQAFFASFRNRRRVDFGGSIRRAMRQETEQHFEYLLRKGRSLVELLDSDYTFLNQDLARHYGIEGVEGREMRKVTVPSDSQRGGILTQGTTLAVTSNPDRTSPVKRGVFILENILGTPPAPPPPNIPALEDAVDESRAREATVSESLPIHRDQPMCASCHNRMDPLGLALENFNTMRRIQDRRSVLDVVLGNASDLNRKLGRGDKEKLDQYLTSVRDIEKRIQKSEQFGPPTDPEIETPAGIPESHADYVQLMYDMLLLAFQTDSTRVATFVLGHDGDNRSFSDIGIPEGHHDLSHHQNKDDRIEKVAQIDHWYVQQFAKFLKKLDATNDIDGNSLLHNSMIVYGSGNADANRHTHEDLPVVLAGNGGGSLASGRHGSEPMSNLFLNLADRMGVEGWDRFGDSTGRLTNI